MGTKIHCLADSELEEEDVKDWKHRRDIVGQWSY